LITLKHPVVKPFVGNLSHVMRFQTTHRIIATTWPCENGNIVHVCSCCDTTVNIYNLLYLHAHTCRSPVTTRCADCVPKNWTTKLMAVTFSNLNRFSKFCHC